MMNWTLWMGIGLCAVLLGLAAAALIRGGTDERVRKERADAFHNGYDCGVAAGKWHARKKHDRVRQRPPLEPMGSWETMEQIARKQRR